MNLGSEVASVGMGVGVRNFQDFSSVLLFTKSYANIMMKYPVETL